MKQEIFQEKFIDRILLKFKMSDCNPKKHPCEPNCSKLDFNDSSPFLEDSTLYREIVGSLIYLMVCTRPDISYIVTKLSQYLSNPTTEHLNIAKNVLRYLKGTKSQGLLFINDSNDINLVGFSDADWAMSKERRRTTGFCFKFNNLEI